jgi:hypothetical protein
MFPDLHDLHLLLHYFDLKYNIHFIYIPDPYALIERKPWEKVNNKAIRGNTK